MRCINSVLAVIAIIPSQACVEPQQCDAAGGEFTVGIEQGPAGAEDRVLLSEPGRIAFGETVVTFPVTRPDVALPAQDSQFEMLSHHDGESIEGDPNHGRIEVHDARGLLLSMEETDENLDIRVPDTRWHFVDEEATGPACFAGNAVPVHPGRAALDVDPDAKLAAGESADVQIGAERFHAQTIWAYTVDDENASQWFYTFLIRLSS